MICLEERTELNSISRLFLAADVLFDEMHRQRKLGMEIDAQSPLFGFIGRLDHQKGVDILLTAILKSFMDTQIRNRAQFVILGCGDPILEAHLRAIQVTYRSSIEGHECVCLVLVSWMCRGRGIF